MTTNFMPLSESFYIAPQIHQTDFAALKEAGITLVINNRPDAEEFGILAVSDAEAAASEHGIKYLHLPMANGQPLPDNVIPDMQAALKEQEENDGKTLAHCRSGTRSSFLWGVIQIIEGKMNTDDVIQTAMQAGINLGGFAPVLQQLENS